MDWIDLTQALDGGRHLLALQAETGLPITPYDGQSLYLPFERRAANETYGAWLAFRLSTDALAAEFLARQELCLIEYQNPETPTVTTIDSRSRTKIPPPRTTPEAPRLDFHDMAAWAAERIQPVPFGKHQMEANQACRYVVEVTYKTGIAKIPEHDIRSTLVEWFSPINRGNLSEDHARRLFDKLSQNLLADIKTPPDVKSKIDRATLADVLEIILQAKRLVTDPA